jgi:hypothetical protein
MKQRLMWILLLLSTGGCAGREIYYVHGCNERLALAEKQFECRACVERPLPHVYLADNPPGARCVRR